VVPGHCDQRCCCLAVVVAVMVMRIAALACEVRIFHPDVLMVPRWCCSLYLVAGLAEPLQQAVNSGTGLSTPVKTVGSFSSITSHH